MQPSGDVYQDAFIVITLPDEVRVYDERAIERFCSYNTSGFTNYRISCKATGNKITIDGGFKFNGTWNMTNQYSLDRENNYMVPPTFYFKLPGLWNPRMLGPVGPFNVTIYDKRDKDEIIYLWHWSNRTHSKTVNNITSYTIEKGPCVQMFEPAVPQSININRGSYQNGAVTQYNFTIVTTNYLTEGDEIVIKLPSPFSFSETSKAIGVSSNLRMQQDTKVGARLDTIQIGLLLPLPSLGRRL